MKTNGFNVAYEKVIDGKTYHMYWKDGDVFAAAEGSTEATGATEIISSLKIGTNGVLVS